MCYGKSSNEPRLLPNPLSSDYSSYLSNPGPDSDSSTCFDMYYLHIVPAVVDSTDSHTVLALLSSIATDSP